ncbi:MAG: heparinase II/III family protein [Thiobacillus sp.]
MSSLLWKLNRLRVMGVAEIAYRVRQALQARLEQRGIGLARPGVPLDRASSPWCTMQPAVQDPEPYREAADRILAGRFDVFALHGAELGFPPRWNRDPKTGTVAPLTFGKTLNYRDEQVVGDIKYVWEPNRHLELVTLAQAWRLTGEMRYAAGCRTLLESWFEQCPYPLGPNWTSSLEHAVRLMNWSVAWRVLGGAESPLFTGADGQDFHTRWLASIYQHCHFIAGHFSKYSSANNHLFGEYTGLFIGALMWPCWKESARWLETARAGLEEEALKQNAPDGVNREQAIWYQHEVADMMLLCGLAGKANGAGFSAAWWDRLERMLEFIAALMDVGGRVPMIGDSDDAVMVRFSREPGFNAYRSLLATGAVMFERGDFARKAGTFDDKSRWLLGEAGDVAFARMAALPSDGTSAKQAFPEGGYYILGDQFDTPDEVRIVADAGPLGYLSIAAHGHADALAFTLSAGGCEILIAPGTYAYHTQKKWRDYFRGTSAHNTVRVDGMDQSLIGGNFLWLKHARAWCEQWESGSARDFFVGAHDGYQHLQDPVLHQRVLEFDKASRVLRVTDTLTCKGTHQVELFWHFAETCRIQVSGNEISAYCEGRSVRLAMPGIAWAPSVVSGQETPPLGWISRRFDQKCNTSSVVWSGQISGTTTLNTEIHLERHDS